MYARYRDRADFLTVYIKEAHPTDEWQMSDNEKEGVCYRQPLTTSERAAVARDFVKRFAYPIPVVVDPIDNPANGIYAGWPERLVVVDEGGRIAYKGKAGPFAYRPQEVEDWLARRFSN